ncbi:MAG: helix-turn-helix domain-containing protein [Oligoflexia bacterium]|nr:helix-turn-helix domain-containing protein [Oligoflexia bacterium]
MFEDSDSSGNAKKTISDSHLNQITVLKAMLAFETGGNEPKSFQIEEIAERCGLSDEREIQRYLFILEGQKLVTPQPEGDFTSKTWMITRHGIKALKTIKLAKAA